MSFANNPLPRFGLDSSSGGGGGTSRGQLLAAAAFQGSVENLLHEANKKKSLRRLRDVLHIMMMRNYQVQDLYHVFLIACDLLRYENRTLLLQAVGDIAKLMSLNLLPMTERNVGFGCDVLRRLHQDVLAFEAADGGNGQVGTDSSSRSGVAKNRAPVLVSAASLVSQLGGDDSVDEHRGTEAVVGRIQPPSKPAKTTVFPVVAMCDEELLLHLTQTGITFLSACAIHNTSLVTPLSLIFTFYLSSPAGSVAEATCKAAISQTSNAIFQTLRRHVEFGQEMSTPSLNSATIERPSHSARSPTTIVSTLVSSGSELTPLVLSLPSIGTGNSGSLEAGSGTATGETVPCEGVMTNTNPNLSASTSSFTPPTLLPSLDGNGVGTVSMATASSLVAQLHAVAFYKDLCAISCGLAPKWLKFTHENVRKDTKGSAASASPPVRLTEAASNPPNVARTSAGVSDVGMNSETSTHCTGLVGKAANEPCVLGDSPVPKGAPQAMVALSPAAAALNTRGTATAAAHGGKEAVAAKKGGSSKPPPSPIGPQMPSHSPNVPRTAVADAFLVCDGASYSLGISPRLRVFILQTLSADLVENEDVVPREVNPLFVQCLNEELVTLVLSCGSTVIGTAVEGGSTDESVSETGAADEREIFILSQKLGITAISKAHRVMRHTIPAILNHHTMLIKDCNKSGSPWKMAVILTMWRKVIASHSLLSDLLLPLRPLRRRTVTMNATDNPQLADVDMAALSCVGRQRHGHTGAQREYLNLSEFEDEDEGKGFEVEVEEVVEQSVEEVAHRVLCTDDSNYSGNYTFQGRFQRASAGSSEGTNSHSRVPRDEDASEEVGTPWAALSKTCLSHTAVCAGDTTDGALSVRMKAREEKSIGSEKENSTNTMTDKVSTKQLSLYSSAYPRSPSLSAAMVSLEEAEEKWVYGRPTRYGKDLSMQLTPFATLFEASASLLGAIILDRRSGVIDLDHVGRSENPSQGGQSKERELHSAAASVKMRSTAIATGGSSWNEARGQKSGTITPMETSRDPPLASTAPTLNRSWDVNSSSDSGRSISSSVFSAGTEATWEDEGGPRGAVGQPVGGGRFQAHSKSIMLVESPHRAVEYAPCILDFVTMVVQGLFRAIENDRPEWEALLGRVNAVIESKLQEKTRESKNTFAVGGGGGQDRTHKAVDRNVIDWQSSERTLPYQRYVLIHHSTWGRYRDLVVLLHPCILRYTTLLIKHLRGVDVVHTVIKTATHMLQVCCVLSLPTQRDGYLNVFFSGLQPRGSVRPTGATEQESSALPQVLPSVSEVTGLTIPPLSSTQIDAFEHVDSVISLQHTQSQLPHTPLSSSHFLFMSGIAQFFSTTSSNSATQVYAKVDADHIQQQQQQPQGQQYTSLTTAGGTPKRSLSLSPPFPPQDAMGGGGGRGGFSKRSATLVAGRSVKADIHGSNHAGQLRRAMEARRVLEQKMYLLHSVASIASSMGNMLDEGWRTVVRCLLASEPILERMKRVSIILQKLGNDINSRDASTGNYSTSMSNVGRGGKSSVGDSYGIEETNVRASITGMFYHCGHNLSTAALETLLRYYVAAALDVTNEVTSGVGSTKLLESLRTTLGFTSQCLMLLVMSAAEKDATMLEEEEGGLLEGADRATALPGVGSNAGKATQEKAVTSTAVSTAKVGPRLAVVWPQVSYFYTQLFAAPAGVVASWMVGDISAFAAHCLAAESVAARSAKRGTTQDRRPSAMPLSMFPVADADGSSIAGMGASTSSATGSLLDLHVAAAGPYALSRVMATWSTLRTDRRKGYGRRTYSSLLQDLRRAEERSLKSQLQRVSSASASFARSSVGEDGEEIDYSAVCGDLSSLRPQTLPFLLLHAMFVAVKDDRIAQEIVREELKLVQSFGQQLRSTSWTTILMLLEGVAQRHSEDVHTAFRVIETIQHSFITNLDTDGLLQLIRCGGSFITLTSAGVEKININLSAVQLLWSVADFLAALEGGDKSMRQLVTAAHWNALLLELYNGCMDRRQEVRHSACKTLFALVLTHGEHLPIESWQCFLRRVLTALLGVVGAAVNGCFVRAKEQAHLTRSSVCANPSGGPLANTTTQPPIAGSTNATDGSAGSKVVRMALPGALVVMSRERDLGGDNDSDSKATGNELSSPRSPLISPVFHYGAAGRGYNTDIESMRRPKSSAAAAAAFSLSREEGSVEAEAATATTVVASAADAWGEKSGGLTWHHRMAQSGMEKGRVAGGDDENLSVQSTKETTQRAGEGKKKQPSRSSAHNEREMAIITCLVLQPRLLSELLCIIMDSTSRVFAANYDSVVGLAAATRALAATAMSTSEGMSSAHRASATERGEELNAAAAAVEADLEKALLLFIHVCGCAQRPLPGETGEAVALSATRALYSMMVSLAPRSALDTGVTEELWLAMEGIVMGNDTATLEPADSQNRLGIWDNHRMTRDTCINQRHCTPAVVSLVVSSLAEMLAHLLGENRWECSQVKATIARVHCIDSISEQWIGRDQLKVMTATALLKAGNAVTAAQTNSAVMGQMQQKSGFFTQLRSMFAHDHDDEPVRSRDRARCGDGDVCLSRAVTEIVETPAAADRRVPLSRLSLPHLAQLLSGPFVAPCSLPTTLFVRFLYMLSTALCCSATMTSYFFPGKVQQSAVDAMPTLLALVWHSAEDVAAADEVVTVAYRDLQHIGKQSMKRERGNDAEALRTGEVEAQWTGGEQKQHSEIDDSGTGKGGLNVEDVAADENGFLNEAHLRTTGNALARGAELRVALECIVMCRLPNIHAVSEYIMQPLLPRKQPSTPTLAGAPLTAIVSRPNSRANTPPQCAMASAVHTAGQMSIESPTAIASHSMSYSSSSEAETAVASDSVRQTRQGQGRGHSSGSCCGSVLAASLGASRSLQDVIPPGSHPNAILSFIVLLQEFIFRCTSVMQDGGRLSEQGNPVTLHSDPVNIPVKVQKKGTKKGSRRDGSNDVQNTDTAIASVLLPVLLPEAVHAAAALLVLEFASPAHLTNPTTTPALCSNLPSGTSLSPMRAGSTGLRNSERTAQVPTQMLVSGLTDSFFDSCEQFLRFLLWDVVILGLGNSHLVEGNGGFGKDGGSENNAARMKMHRRWAAAVQRDAVVAACTVFDTLIRVASTTSVHSGTAIRSSAFVRLERLCSLLGDMIHHFMRSSCNLSSEDMKGLRANEASGSQQVPFLNAMSSVLTRNAAALLAALVPASTLASSTLKGVALVSWDVLRVLCSQSQRNPQEGASVAGATSSLPSELRSSLRILARESLHRRDTLLLSRYIEVSRAKVALSGEVRKEGIEEDYKDLEVLVKETLRVMIASTKAAAPMRASEAGDTAGIMRVEEVSTAQTTPRRELLPYLARMIGRGDAELQELLSQAVLGILASLGIC